VKVPDQGDIIVLDFDPQAGHAQMKRRPALVLSPAAFNETFGLAFVAPVTTKPKGHAFEVPLPSDSRVKGVIMVHQLKSLDWRARRARIATRVPASVLAAAREIVADIVNTA
jgi:mRNA interferase MazF